MTPKESAEEVLKYTKDKVILLMEDEEYIVDILKRILLSDKSGEVIAALHSGRAGCKLNIAKKCLDIFLDRYGVLPKDILVSLSPTIRGCCYEVSGEIAKDFREYKEGVICRDGRYFLDIVQIISKQLLDGGVLARHIEINPSCSCCSGEIFSYRRDKYSGRAWAVIHKN